MNEEWLELQLHLLGITADPLQVASNSPALRFQLTPHAKILLSPAISMTILSYDALTIQRGTELAQPLHVLLTRAPLNWLSRSMCCSPEAH